jgi:hypothetical protein
MKYSLIYIFILFSFFAYTQEGRESLPPKFLDPGKDTVAFVNCSQETFDTLIKYVRRNPKYVIDKDISCRVNVICTIFENFDIGVGTDAIKVYLGFKDKKSRKYETEIRNFYIDQARRIVTNLYGLCIPERKNGTYLPSKFSIDIDFIKGDKRLVNDTLESEQFDKEELSYETIRYNNRLRVKGMELLKAKKPQLAFIYFRMAYFINKDIESVVLLGNLWNVMGEPDTACKTWKMAADKENRQAQELIKNCK